MKYLAALICCIVLVVSVYIFYDRHLSSDANVGSYHRMKAKGLSIGMSKREMLGIMGSPDTLYFSDGKEVIFYTTHDRSNMYIIVVFDSTKRILELHGIERE